MLTASDVSEMFAEVLPGTLIDEFSEELGLVERERKIDMRALIRALVLTAGTPSGGLQADALRNYLQTEGVRPIVRSAFYKRFTPKLETLMAKLSTHALEVAGRLEVDLPGYLGGVVDWHIVDSETVRLRDELKEEYLGSGDYAAVKIHKTFSVGTGCPVAYHFAPARPHDSLHLTIDESWTGHGLLADLAYASVERLEACERHGVRFVIRLKENWQPKVDHIARGTLTKTFLKGTDLDALLEDEVLLLDGKAIDADVTVGEKRLAMRMVGILTPKGYCFFLTNLPAKVGPLQVADAYRIRWEIELSNKLDKSVHRLDETAATKACAVRTMLHASLLASTIVAIVVHRHHLATRPKAGKPREIAPLHPMMVARLFAEENKTIASAMGFDEDGHPEVGAVLWKGLALGLQRLGSDPNWRRRPSVLDRLRGTKPTPPRKPKKRLQGLKETLK